MDFSDWFDSNKGFFVIIGIILFMVGGFFLFYNSDDTFLESMNYECEGELSLRVEVYNEAIISCDDKYLFTEEHGVYENFIFRKLIMFLLYSISCLFFCFLVIPYLTYLSIKLYNLYFRRKH